MRAHEVRVKEYPEVGFYDHGTVAYQGSPGSYVCRPGRWAVLLDLKSGQYYGLNEVGTYIWSLIDAPRTVADIVAAMAEEFDVSREQLNLDVMNFLQQMEEQKLIEISHG